MPILVADTSGLVSLGTVHDVATPPLDAVLGAYAVFVPGPVVEELEEMARYDDGHGVAATRVLDRLVEATVEPVTLDDSFPLDVGENAAVSLANGRNADLLLCDEFNRLPFVHASLADTRLVTTPTLLRVLHRRDISTADEARELLDRIGAARSWDANSYVRRVKESF